MRFDVLHNFISPVTGRILVDFNYVPLGNRQGIGIPSPILIDIRLDLINLRKRYNSLVDADFVIGHANDQIPNAQVLSRLDDGYLFSTAGIVSTTGIIPIGDLPDLTYTFLWTGNIFNRPIEVQTIIIDNLPNLTFKSIWRGNALNRPIESDDLTTVETNLGNALAQLASLGSLVSSLASTVSALQSIVAGLEAGLASIGGWVGIALMQTQIIGLIAAVAATNARIDNLRLNTISADADVSFYGFKGINFADPTNPQDAATKHYVDTAIGGGAAPNTATYILQTSNASLANAQVLASLTTGIVKNTTTTGVLSIATAGTDYYAPGFPTFTAYAVICAGTTSTGTLQNVVGVGISGQVLTSSGAGALPTWVTPTAGTVTSVSGTTNVITVTNPTTTPVINISAAYIGQTSITTLGTITTGVWNGSVIPLANGGSNANLTASNGGIVYSTASAMAILAGTATSNQILLSGANTTPSWSTVTHPSTTTINQILYSSAANVISGLTTGNNGALVTGATGIPSISSTLPSAVQGNITTLGTITTGVWNGSVIPLANGGSNANLTASNGGIVYSTASALAILAGTATANRVLLSGLSAAPSWSTATYPATTTISQILYSSAANTVSGLATANNGTLVTSGTGVPSISSTLPSAVQANITTVGTITTGVWNGSVIPLANGGSNANLTANNGGIVYSTASALAILAGTATANQVLLSGATAAPSWSTATYPATTTINQLLYSSAANVISGLATANNGTLVTGATGIPSISSTLPSAVQANITTVGTITTGVWNGSVVPMANGGTNANLTANNGGIIYSTASAMAVLAGTAVANRILLSGATAAPAWSTATYPATTTINQILYSSAANTVTGLATANSAVLLTNGSGVPAWQTLTSNVVTSITGTANQITASASTGAVTLSLPTDVIISNSLTAANLELIGNILQSNNSNGSITIAPNGSGNILMIPSGSTGAVTINRTSALAKFHVVGGIQNVSGEDSAIRVEGANTNVKIELNSTANGGKLYELRSNSNGNFDCVDRTGSAEKFIVNATGFAFGAAATNPAFDGDCSGTLRTKRLIGNGNAPTFAIQTPAGTGATGSIAGTELSGVFTLTAGTGATTGNLVTFTLSSAMTSINYGVIFTAWNNLAGALIISTPVLSSSTFSLSTASTLVASIQYKWNYVIIGV